MTKLDEPGGERRAGQRRAPDHLNIGGSKRSGIDRRCVAGAGGEASSTAQSEETLRPVANGDAGILSVSASVEPVCTGPFSNAFDCPVHDPRRQPAVEPVAAGELPAIPMYSPWVDPKAWHDYGATLRYAAEQLRRERDEAVATLAKVNNIRNSIIGMQAINWSEHIYPLVEALEDAGISGMPYPEARGKFGTMLERTLAAEGRLAEVEAGRRWHEGLTRCPHCAMPLPLPPGGEDAD